MSIISIEIKNFKSIEYLKLKSEELNAFVGKNGVGKSIIVEAISYFYNNLIDSNTSQQNFDKLNRYKSNLEISIEFDFSRILSSSSGSYEIKLSNMINKKRALHKHYQVIMSQKKNNQIVWNIDYDERYIIHNSHPIYICDTRSINLTNWDTLWDSVGDLINAKDINPILKELDSTLKSKEYVTFNNYSKLFTDFLKSNQLSVLDTTKKQKIISLLQVQIGGSVFNNEGRDLSFFSDGTNSKNYILFLSYIAYEISQKRLKDPTIILDEPELGLHPKMIDEIMEKIIIYSSKVNFFLFSHSPRLVASILRNNGILHKVTLAKGYTTVKKLINNIEDSTKLFITDRETSCLFSDFILFVEGVTEVEIFTNKIIQKLFPFMKDIDIVNTSSNDHILKLIAPNRNNSDIPFLNLVDMDKLIEFKKGSDNNATVKVKSVWYSPLSNTSYLERNIKNYAKTESKHALYLRNKILSEGESGFNYTSKFKVLYDFDEYYNYILHYCVKDNIYPVKSTIEGVLINPASIRYLKKWLIKYKNVNFKNLNKILKNKDSFEINTIYRYIFSGKNDILEKFNIEKFDKKYKIINDAKIKKNSEWITSFFEYYEKSILNQKQYEKDYLFFKRRERFKKDFPALYDIINIVEKKISAK